VAVRVADIERFAEMKGIHVAVTEQQPPELHCGINSALKQYSEDWADFIAALIPPERVFSVQELAD